MVQNCHLTIRTAVANQSGAMEADTISKNGRISKSHTSRRKYYIREMRKICFTLIVVLGFGIIANAQESKLRIAVLNFEDKCYYDRDKMLAKDIPILLTTELVNTNKYRVVERSRIDQIIKEQKFQNTQDISAQAVALGKLLGVHKIIIGEISKYDWYQCEKDNVSARLIDIETGDIEVAVIISFRELRPDTSSKKAIRKGWTRTHILNEQEIVQKLISELFK